MARIGVESGLSSVKDALKEMGHEIVDIRSEHDAVGCDSVIISGMEKDMMGMANTVIEGAVINAEGASVEDVCQIINNRFN